MIESHELKNRDPYVKKLISFQDTDTGEDHHRYPPLRQIQPVEADDPAFARNWHPTGTDRGDEL